MTHKLRCDWWDDYNFSFRFCKVSYWHAARLRELVAEWWHTCRPRRALKEDGA